MNKLYGLTVSFIAGISTLFGFFSIYIKGDKNKIIGNSLSFAGGVMIMLSIIDLLPTSITNLRIENNYCKSNLYSLISFFIGYFGCHYLQKAIHKTSDLYETGIMSMLGIIIHNIPEGIVTYILSSIDLKLGILLAIVIIFHNIPEGIGIAIPIYYSTKSKKKAFAYTFISGFSETFGALVAMLFIHKYISNTIIGIIFSVISGLMVYIGYSELINTSKIYESKNVKYFTLLGCIFILVVEIILKM